MKFRKKPVEIEAVRWTGTVESATEVIDWALSQDGTIRFHEGQWPYDDGVHVTDGNPPHLSIDTLEETMFAGAGDFIIRGSQGEFYPCKPDIFEEAYEPVAEDPS